MSKTKITHQVTILYSLVVLAVIVSLLMLKLTSLDPAGLLGLWENLSVCDTCIKEVTVLPLNWLTLETIPSKIFQRSAPVKVTSATRLPKGNEVKTSPIVMGPASMVARIPSR